KSFKEITNRSIGSHIECFFRRRLFLSTMFLFCLDRVSHPADQHRGGLPSERIRVFTFEEFTPVWIIHVSDGRHRSFQCFFFVLLVPQTLCVKVAQGEPGMHERLDSRLVLLHAGFNKPNRLSGKERDGLCSLEDPLVFGGGDSVQVFLLVHNEVDRFPLELAHYPSRAGVSLTEQETSLTWLIDRIESRYSRAH